MPAFIYDKLRPYLKDKHFNLEITGGSLLANEFANDPRYSDKDWFLCAGSAFNRPTQIQMVFERNFDLNKC